MPSLSDHVRREAGRRPDAEAATDGERRLSYGDLDLRAARIARCLRDHGVGRGALVLLTLRRSVEYLAAEIGVLEAGAAYVPIEARTPPPRRAQVVRDCRPSAVICDAGTVAGLLADEEVRRAGRYNRPCSLVLLDVDEFRQFQEACGGPNRSIPALVGHVRARLARQISDLHTSPAGYIPMITLSPEWEQIFAESLIGQGEERQLSLPPSRLQEFINKVRQVFERQAMVGENPVLLTSAIVRPYVRSIIERFRPMTMVMSQNEVHAKARIKTLGQI